MNVPWALVHRAVVVLVFVFAAAVIRAIERPGGSWGAHLRRRFVAGVPWGTLVVVGFVLAVYLFVQQGWSHWFDPVVVAFRAWSYLYPLGMLTAAFSHAGPGHLLGNLFGTVVLAPIVEYWWGHFPRERGATSFGSWRTNPLLRGFVLFPAAVIAVGLFTALFTIGPVIGFSGVVFAFAGFALVRYPLGTVVAITASSAVNALYRAISDPWTVASGHPAYYTPWWADIAIQGHAIGLLAGVVLGVVHAQSRSESTPSAHRVAFGTLLFGAEQALWAVYWYRGGDTYVLYRAIGTALLLGLATIVAVGVAGSDRPLLPGVTLPVDRETFTGALRTASARQVGVVLLVVSLALLSGPAVPVNLTTVSDEPLPGETIEVRGYEVTYAENVESGMISAIEIEAFGETTSVNTSGVIVRNDDRHIWTTMVSKGRLAFAGRNQVTLGGVGWRETVVVVREGWTAVEGGAAYRVSFREDGEKIPVFTSKPARAGLVIAGQNLSVAVDEQRFYVVVSQNNSSVRAPLPEQNESVTLQNVTFVRQGKRIVAVHEDTRVTVFRKEQYRGRGS